MNPGGYPCWDLTERIIAAGLDVHGALGPGLLESTYECCLADELQRRGLRFRRQVAVPVFYKGRQLDCGYRLDFLVEGAVIVELKSVERLERLHEAQLMTYLRLTGKPVGLIMNFNVQLLRDGIVRRAMSASAVSASPR